jgi:SAM-dependent methyltransferase
MSFYRDQLESYLKTINVNCNTVFDIGGKQKPIKGRTASWNVKDYKIFDIPEYNLDTKNKHDSKCDMLFCLEVFEYLLVPTVAMENINDMLKNGGLAIVSFAFIYPLHNEVEFDSLRYTSTSIKRLAKHAKLEILNVKERKAKTGSLVKYYSEDGMKCAKGHGHDATGFIATFRKPH